MEEKMNNISILEFFIADKIVSVINVKAIDFSAKSISVAGRVYLFSNYDEIKFNGETIYINERLERIATLEDALSKANSNVSYYESQYANAKSTLTQVDQEIFDLKEAHKIELALKDDYIKINHLNMNQLENEISDNQDAAKKSKIKLTVYRCLASIQTVAIAAILTASLWYQPAVDLFNKIFNK